MKDKISDKCPQTPVPHYNAIHRLIDKFHKTGSIESVKQIGRLSKLIKQKLLDISDANVAKPIKLHVEAGTAA